MLHAVLLAGGPGTRFWPWSRAARPKPFLPIAGRTPLLAETARRVLSLVPLERILVVTHRSLLARVREALPDLPPRQIVGEPASRNTAPSIGVAAVRLLREDPDAILAALPSDHLIRPSGAFARALRAGEKVAETGALVLFGIRPDRPATGYGYVRRGRKRGSVLGLPVFEVDRFHEKPDLARARAYLRSGRHRWNSGVFVGRADSFLEAIRLHLPALGRRLDRFSRAGRGAAGRAFEAVFSGLQPVSIDRGVLERASGLRMIEPKVRWSDIGSWASLAELRPPGRDGHVVLTRRKGAFVAIDSRRCLAWSSVPHLVAAIGADDLVIAHTPDATLVCPRSRAEEVRRVVDRLRAHGMGRWL